MQATESRWKIIACDLDGTLIGWNHKINDRDLEALRQARAAGFHVAICTGRNVLESAGIIRTLDLTGPGVFVNGAMVCDMATGRAMDSQVMADDLAREAINFFGARGHATLVLADDAVTRLPAYAFTEHGPAHRATTEWLLANRIQTPPVGEVPAGFWGRIVRLGIVVNVDEAAPLHADLQQQFAQRAATHSIYSPKYDCQIVEFFHPAVNKWTGLEHLARAVGSRPDQIIAIGDDINDIAMLQGAALSFAMANAAPEVRNAAKRATASQEQCGVAHVIEALLRGEF